MHEPPRLDGQSVRRDPRARSSEVLNMETDERPADEQLRVWRMRAPHRRGGGTTTPVAARQGKSRARADQLAGGIVQ